jgi:hypothetical protein
LSQRLALAFTDVMCETASLCLRSSSAAEAVLQVAFVVVEAQGAKIVAYTAIGIVVICSVVVLAYDFRDLKLSAVVFARRIRLVFFT